jgi:hypothetical protein
VYARKPITVSAVGVSLVDEGARQVLRYWCSF